jgi:hypothetical protein
MHDVEHHAGGGTVPPLASHDCCGRLGAGVPPEMYADKEVCEERERIHAPLAGEKEGEH